MSLSYPPPYNPIQATLSWHLYTLTHYTVGEPLLSSGISLPIDWGLPVAWSLAILPVTPIVLGAVLHMVWFTNGVPISLVSITYELTSCL